MPALFLWVLALRRLVTGPPLGGPRLVLPLPPFAPGTCVEIGFQDGHPALRLSRPASQPALPPPPWDDPDADLGRHDFFASL